MWMGPLPLTHVQDRHPVIHTAISVLMEAVCFPSTMSAKVCVGGRGIVVVVIQTCSISQVYIVV